MSHDLELGDALNEAVRAQFIHLFGVLVKDVTDRKQALERFKNGLTNLAEAEYAVAELLREKEKTG